MLATRAAAAALGLGLSALSTRILTPAEFGALAAALAALALLMRLASLGLGQAAQYFGALEASNERSYRAELLIPALCLFVVSLGLMTAFAEPLSALVLSNEPSAEILAVLGYAVSFTLLHFVAATYLLGRRDFRMYNLLILLPPLVTAAYLAATLLRGGGLDDVIFAYELQFFTGLLLATLVFFPRRLANNLPKSRDVRRVFGYGVKSFVVFLLAFSAGQLALLIGAWFADPEELGRFAAARLAAEAILVVYGAIGPMVFSHVGAMKPEDDPGRFLPPVASLCLWLFIGIALTVALLAIPALAIAFGRQYAEGAPAVWALLPGMVLSGSQRVLENYLYGRDRQGSVAFVHVVSIAVLLVCGALLIPRFGAVGIGGACSASFAVSYALTAGIVWRVDRINPLSLLVPSNETLEMVYRRSKTLMERLCAGR